MSAAFPLLRDLAVGDAVPSELYLLDRKDGARPDWRVRSIEELPVTGGRVLIVVDESADYVEDLFGRAERLVALKIITHANKTLRSQPYLLGGPSGPTLCDLDQQGRHAERQGWR